MVSKQDFKEFQDRVEHLLVMNRDSYSPAIMKQDIDNLTKTVTDFGLQLESHMNKYQGFYRFLDAAAEARELGGIVGTTVYHFMKTILLTAATVGAFYALVKGGWQYVIALMVQPFLK